MGVLSMYYTKQGSGARLLQLCKAKEGVSHRVWEAARYSPRFLATLSSHCHVLSVLCTWSKEYHFVASHQMCVCCCLFSPFFGVRPNRVATYSEWACLSRNAGQLFHCFGDGTDSASSAVGNRQTTTTFGWWRARKHMAPIVGDYIFSNKVGEGVFSKVKAWQAKVSCV